LPLARELAERQVGVLYAYGDEAIAAAQIATGFVESLARPGGNTTGVTCITTELSGKRVAVLHEMVPRLKRLAVLYNPENKSKPMDFAQTREAAKSFGVGRRFRERKHGAGRPGRQRTCPLRQLQELAKR